MNLNSSFVDFRSYEKKFQRENTENQTTEMILWLFLNSIIGATLSHLQLTKIRKEHILSP